MRRRSRKRGPSSPAEALRISLTIAGEKASNKVVVHISPSREEKLLSDHVFSFFGRTITITSHEELLAIIVMVVVATAWAVQQFRRRRSIVLQRSVVSDQLVYELSRIADALDRISNRPADQVIAAASSKQTEESTGGRIPLSMFGR
jgi:hypothetical protein